MSERNKPLCYICQSDQHLTSHQLFEHVFWRCSACSLDFIWPVPSRKELTDFYNRPEWFEGGETGGYKDYEVQTESSLKMFEAVLDQYGSGHSLLDIGCGYGLHMKMARDRGWSCFGIEPSKHARAEAGKRFNNSLFIVDAVENMIPHEFDLIIMFDVIEHLSNPCQFFYKLFSIGAIAPHTEILITTPNARSNDALRSGRNWQYLHPPSHLTFYSGAALKKLFNKLLFKNVTISGLYPEGNHESPGPLPPGEKDSVNLNLSAHNGLFCKASGSTFKSFMQERYVPGTWSKLARYEHLPRYLFATEFLARHVSQVAHVLDFGCGVGYGTRMMSAQALNVTGLDIDASALTWAKTYYGGENISYIRSETLGAELPSSSFDLITCFEVLEHVNQATQQKLLSLFKRLLKKTGILLISTPNPDITAQYGENEFHIREMQREEFKRFLEHDFDNVFMLEQRMTPSVVISQKEIPQQPTVSTNGFDGRPHTSPPVAYIAVCTDNFSEVNLDFCYMDHESDLVSSELSQQERYYKALGQIFDLKNRI